MRGLDILGPEATSSLSISSSRVPGGVKWTHAAPRDFFGS